MAVTCVSWYRREGPGKVLSTWAAGIARFPPVLQDTQGHVQPLTDWEDLPTASATGVQET